MIPKNINKEAILAALKQIDDEGVPKRRNSRKFYLKHDGKAYPPKLAISIANKIVNGFELPSLEFSGGDETNSFLQAMGFEIIGKKVKKSPQNDSKIKIITATFQYKGKDIPANKFRMKLLKSVITANKDANIILFPAGSFILRRINLSKAQKVTKEIGNILHTLNSNSKICFGIDSSDGKDQLAFAVDRNGILAIGRKFYPTHDEIGFINQAKSFDAEEWGFPRFFESNGKRYYLAVCYDGFGIRHNNIPNPNVDIVLVLAHRFHVRGEGPSGDVDFARKGFAGAAMQWNCPVFGTAVFFGREVPEKWPTGIIWENNGKSVKSFKYEDNKLQYVEKNIVIGKNEQAICYKYII